LTNLGYYLENILNFTDLAGLDLTLQNVLNPFNQPYYEFAAVLLIAVLADLIFQEPPTAIHPVVLIGKWISFVKKHVPNSYKKLYGIFIGLSTIFISGAGAFLILYLTNLDFVPAIIRVIIQAFFLKATFAIRSMITPANAIYKEMKTTSERENIRFELRTYVSRDTKKLSDEHIVSAIVESISENYVDSILSPIFYYAVFGPYGLIAAYCFKAASTLDSMVGYKDEIHKEIGWFSAKTDDVLNFIPARISPVFLAIGAICSNFIPKIKPKPEFSAKECIKCTIKYHSVSKSPNSGWSMAAAAGALKVKLVKEGEYVIGELYEKVNIEDIKRISILLITSSVILVTIFLFVMTVIPYIFRFCFQIS